MVLMGARANPAEDVVITSSEAAAAVERVALAKKVAGVLEAAVVTAKCLISRDLKYVMAAEVAAAPAILILLKRSMAAKSTKGGAGVIP